MNNFFQGIAVLRFIFLSFFILLFHTHAFAVHYCAPDKLGTSRTIKLAPLKQNHNTLTHFFGHEKELGLNNKEIILTFDDGPQKGTTDKVLSILKQHCIKATFFVVGRMARLYPTLLEQIAKEGHTIAHHTHHHEKLPLLNRKDIQHSVNDAASMVEKIAYGESHTQTKTPFFRYPYLYYNETTDKILAKDGWMAFGGNIESRDWEASSGEQVFNTIVANIEKQQKGIVLMHDIQTETADMLPDLLQYLKYNNYKIVHIQPAHARQKNSFFTTTIRTLFASNKIEKENNEIIPTYYLP